MTTPRRIAIELNIDFLCNRYGMEAVATAMIENPKWNSDQIEKHLLAEEAERDNPTTTPTKGLTNGVCFTELQN